MVVAKTKNAHKTPVWNFPKAKPAGIADTGESASQFTGIRRQIHLATGFQGALQKGKKMTEKIIIYDSPEAAELRQITGWVSSDGRFYGNDEHLARWAGCTHLKCKCGKLMRKGYTLCRNCRDRVDAEKYNARPKASWDGEAMVYAEATGDYYNSPDEAEDALTDGGTLADLHLILCRPCGLSLLEKDYWDDDLPEDGELPDGVLIALENLNEAIEKAGTASWFPGEFALDLEEPE